MAKWHYHLVDVFTEEPFGGNPLAVFPDGQEVPERCFQQIAKELNLSETTFVLPAREEGTDFHVRIFTPGGEVPMAGHPTIGTAFVLAREKRFPLSGETARVVFEEGVGAIPVDVQVRQGAPGLITMEQPLPEFGPQFQDRAALAETLSLAEGDLAEGLPCQVVSCGLPFLFVPLRGMEAVKRARVRTELWENLLRNFAASGLFVFSMETDRPESTVHSRMFAPTFGIAEDPATGSASGPLGAYLVTQGLVRAEPRVELIGEQGFEMGRPSIIHIAIEQDGGTGGAISRVQVGGRSIAMGGGWFQLP